MGKGLPYKLFREFYIPGGANEKFFSTAADYSPKSGDIFIVSYPKCGTTWVQHIVYLLHRNGQPADSIAQVISSIPFPEQDGFPSTDNIYAYKYHLPFKMMRYSRNAKYIHIARNPKDACVSYFNFLKKLPGYEIDSFDDFFEAFVSGELPYGDFVDFVHSWYEKRHLDNILFLTYESLTHHTKESILEIASFLGFQQLGEGIIENVLKYSSFDYMKNMDEDVFMQRYLKNSTHQTSDKNVRPQMMRKGIVGDWKNYFDQEKDKIMKEYLISRSGGKDLAELWEKNMQ